MNETIFDGINKIGNVINGNSNIINDNELLVEFLKQRVYFLEREIELKDKEIVARDRDIEIFKKMIDEIEIIKNEAEKSRIMVTDLYERKIADLKGRIDDKKHAIELLEKEIGIRKGSNNN